MGTLLLSLVPSAQAVAITEGFEDYTPPSQPTTSDDYTFVSSNANVGVSANRSHSGDQSLRFRPTATGGHAAFELSGYDGCNSSPVTFWLNFEALGDTVASTFLIGLSNTNSAVVPQTTTLQQTTAGNLQFNSVVIATATLDTWADFTLYRTVTANGGVAPASPCDATYSYQDCISSVTLEYAACTTVAVDTDVGPLDNLVLYSQDNVAPFPLDVFIDDLSWDDGTIAATPDRFCANPGESNFGYDYVEGVEFNDDIFTAGISLEDAFVFEGDSGNSEYLAKGYDPGSEAFLVRARLEASGEGASSKFRIAFTTGATVLTAGSGGDLTTDLAASSDGEDGGNFDNHVQIIFIENSNSWGISAWYNVGGAGLTQIPGSLNYGANPNSPTTFQVVVNSGTTDLPTSVDNHTIPDIGHQVISVQDGDGNIIFQWQIPAGLFNAEWKDQWFIGKGTGVANAFTYLDDTDQLQDDDSTCLWDLLGTGTRTGSAGLAPGSTIIDPPDDGGGGGGFSDLFAPENMDSQLFIGFLLVAGIIFTGVRQGVLGVGLVAFFMLGLGLAFALGWMPMWLILVLFVVSLAAVWFLPKPSGDGV